MDIKSGNGKLTWRVEWAARWKIFNVTCEPFGKDHAASGGSYDVSSIISKEKIAIGCKSFTVEEWKEFDDDKISKMDDGSLEWWNQWKEVILMFHANVFC